MEDEFIQEYEVDVMRMEEYGEEIDEEQITMKTTVMVVCGILVVSGMVGLTTNLVAVCTALTNISANLINVYAVQLALANVLYLLCTPIISANGFLLTWPFSDAVCKMTMGSVYAAMYVRAALRMAMCVDMYKVSNPQYTLTGRRRACTVASTAIWVMGTLLFCLYAFMYELVDISMHHSMREESEQEWICVASSYFPWQLTTFLVDMVVFTELCTVVTCCSLLASVFPEAGVRRGGDLSEDDMAARRLVVATTACYTPLCIAFLMPRIPLMEWLESFLIRHITVVLPFIDAAADGAIYIWFRRHLAYSRASGGDDHQALHISYVNLPDL